MVICSAVCLGGGIWNSIPSHYKLHFLITISITEVGKNYPTPSHYQFPRDPKHATEVISIKSSFILQSIKERCTNSNPNHHQPQFPNNERFWAPKLRKKQHPGSWSFPFRNFPTAPKHAVEPISIQQIKTRKTNFKWDGWCFVPLPFPASYPLQNTYLAKHPNFILGFKSRQNPRNHNLRLPLKL